MHDTLLSTLATNALAATLKSDHQPNLNHLLFAVTSAHISSKTRMSSDLKSPMMTCASRVAGRNRIRSTYERCIRYRLARLFLYSARLLLSLGRRLGVEFRLTNFVWRRRPSRTVRGSPSSVLDHASTVDHLAVPFAARHDGSRLPVVCSHGSYSLFLVSFISDHEVASVSLEHIQMSQCCVRNKELRRSLSS